MYYQENGTENKQILNLYLLYQVVQFCLKMSYEEQQIITVLNHSQVFVFNFVQFSY